MWSFDQFGVEQSYRIQFWKSIEFFKIVIQKRLGENCECFVIIYIGICLEGAWCVRVEMIVFREWRRVLTQVQFREDFYGDSFFLVSFVVQFVQGILRGVNMVLLFNFWGYSQCGNFRFGQRKFRSISYTGSRSRVGQLGILLICFRLLMLQWEYVVDEY